MLLRPWVLVRRAVSARKACRRSAFRERLRKSLEEKSTVGFDDGVVSWYLDWVGSHG